jgi:hypothetical protein
MGERKKLTDKYTSILQPDKKKKDTLLERVPDNIHGLVDDVRLVDPYDQLGSSVGRKKGEHPCPTPDVQHHLVCKQVSILLDEGFVGLRASFILHIQHHTRISRSLLLGSILLYAKECYA